MPIIFLPLFISIVVFIGMLLGGVISILIHTKISDRVERIYVFSGGLLAGLIMLEILPESLKMYPNQGLLIGFFIAIIFISMSDHIIHRVLETQSKNSRLNQVFSFFFLVLAVLFHNIPTGLAIGSSASMEALNNSPLLVATFLHHVPEGLALMISTLVAGFNLKPFLLAAVILTAVLGSSTVFGMILSGKSMKLDAILMGSAIGALSYVSFYEMLWRTREKVSNIEFAAFSIVGIGIIWLYFLVLG
jgi:ZIP family zinc transporter